MPAERLHGAGARGAAQTAVRTEQHSGWQAFPVKGEIANIWGSALMQCLLQLLISAIVAAKEP